MTGVAELEATVVELRSRLDAVREVCRRHGRAQQARGAWEWRVPYDEVMDAADGRETFPEMTAPEPIPAHVLVAAVRHDVQRPFPGPHPIVAQRTVDVLVAQAAVQPEIVRTGLVQDIEYGLRLADGIADLAEWRAEWVRARDALAAAGQAS